MSTSLREYIDANASLPPDCVLGNLTWFEVSEGAYEGDLMESEFTRLGLNPTFLPRPLNAADAFEKASSELHGEKYTVSLGTGQTATAKLHVRPVARTDQVIERHLVREIVDSSNRRLYWDKVGEFVYYRPTTQVNNRVVPGTERVRTSVEPIIEGPERDLVTSLFAKFDASYDQYRRFHDGQKMRAIFRNYLLFLNAIPMKEKGGGIYFVHVTRSDELGSLKEFADTMGCRFTMWQLPDIPAMRDEVIETFQREGEKEFANVVKEVAALTSKRTRITPAAFAKVKDQYDDALLKVAEYTRVLRTSQDRTGSAAGLAREALLGLQGQMLKGAQSA